LKGTWGACSQGRYGPAGFCPSNQNLTASTGDYLEFTVGAGDDVISFDTSATAYDNCDLGNVQTLVDNTKHSVAGYMIFKMVFNKPGTYYLSSSVTTLCASGVKMKITVSGTDKGANEFTAFKSFAPSATANPGDDDDFVAFGKGVYHKRAMDHDLTSECSSAYCLDKKVSRGSCYYSGADFHFGHGAILCDVSEEECCGYIGCKGKYKGEDTDSTNRGKFQNGTYHNYYWYPPSDVDTGGCCRCFGGCDRSKENSTKAPGGVCTYRDITSKKTATTEECQRNVNYDVLDSKSIAYLECPVPDDVPSITAETDSVPENMMLRISEYYATSAAPRSPMFSSAIITSLFTWNALLAKSDSCIRSPIHACALIAVALMVSLQFTH
jgi:hypothetical protein